MKSMIDHQKLYHCLSDIMGPSGWWPAETKLEIIIGAILVQNTTWHNASLALQNLKETTQLDPEKILSLPMEALQQLIRSSGFYKNKSQSLIAVLEWFSHHAFDYEAIQTTYGDSLKSELLTLRGVGLETADVFLVYIFDQVVFIADLYARRLYQLLEDREYKDYEALQQAVELPETFTYRDAQEFHGLIDEYAKVYLNNEIMMRNLKERLFSD